MKLLIALPKRGNRKLREMEPAIGLVTQFEMGQKTYYPAVRAMMIVTTLPPNAMLLEAVCNLCNAICHSMQEMASTILFAGCKDDSK